MKAAKRFYQHLNQSVNNGAMRDGATATMAVSARAACSNPGVVRAAAD
jgi:hypothetical protein